VLLYCYCRFSDAGNKMETQCGRAAITTFFCGTLFLIYMVIWVSRMLQKDSHDFEMHTSWWTLQHLLLRAGNPWCTTTDKRI
jgi:hypothetical protein